MRHLNPAAIIVSWFAVTIASAIALSLSSWEGSSNYTGPANAICTRQIYTLKLPPYISTSFDPTILPNPNQTVVTSLLQRYFSSPANFTAAYISGTYTTSISQYNLSGVLCVPKAGDKHKGTVQLLVHGAGFDSSYWDFDYKPEIYSYVKAAADAGYTTFRYDRLGTGKSEHPVDGYRTVQASTDLAILAEFTSLLRSGGINGMVFTQIVAVGHSYGSIQLTALSLKAPTAVDALVLTGFSVNGSYTPISILSLTYSVALNIFPLRFGALPGAYLVAGLPQATQLNFFYYPNYDEAAAEAHRLTEEPITQGVLLTVETLLNGLPSSFRGPVHVVTGDRDWVFCGDQCNIVPYCSNLTVLELVQPTAFPMTSDFSVYSPPNTGHALNQHYSAPRTYAEMLGWITALQF